MHKIYNTHENNLTVIKTKEFQFILDAVASLVKFPLDSLIGSINTELFYRYPGSLTTPGCYESVTWTGFAEPQEISHQQVVSQSKL